MRKTHYWPIIFFARKKYHKIIKLLFSTNIISNANEFLYEYQNFSIFFKKFRQLYWFPLFVMFVKNFASFFLIFLSSFFFFFIYKATMENREGRYADRFFFLLKNAQNVFYEFRCFFFFKPTNLLNAEKMSNDEQKKFMIDIALIFC